MATLPFEELSPADLRTRTSLKWRHHGPDVIPVWVAEMDVSLAPEVVDALVRAARVGDTGYPAAGRDYAQAFAQFAQRTWDWAPDPADTVMCADVMTGVRTLLDALVPPGGSVVVPVPVYPPFLMVAEMGDRTAIPVPLTPAGRLDLPAIEEALGRSSAAVVLLCNPHNPTGTVHTAGELTALATIADALGVAVVSDEIHAPLVPDGATFVPWLAVSDSGFTVTSAAKAWNLAGLKAGLIAAGPQSRAALRALPGHLPYGASHIGVIGHTAGWLADPAWLGAVNANIAANRDLLRTLLAETLPEIGYRVPQATYLAWLDCRALDLGDDPAEAFLRRGRVALTQGPPFGPGGQEHARLNLACSSAVLSEAVDRMRATVAPGSVVPGAVVPG